MTSYIQAVEKAQENLKKEIEDLRDFKKSLNKFCKKYKGSGDCEKCPNLDTKIKDNISNFENIINHISPHTKPIELKERLQKSFSELVESIK